MPFSLMTGPSSPGTAAAPEVSEEEEEAPTEGAALRLHGKMGNCNEVSQASCTQTFVFSYLHV